jgi:hypothetical protein
MRHEHQQFLVDLESKLLSLEFSPAEYTALCLLPELVRKKTGFQKSPLFKDQRTHSPVMEFIRNFSWKGHTERIRRSLFQWHESNYPLVLSNQIPKPLELLKIQAEGQRIITVFNQASQWQENHLGKTAWEFTVHDLIHADHFFQKSDWQTGQIAFYKFVLENWDEPIIADARTFFSDQFDYLISDMNSHPQHMYQTLNALCLMSRKKKLQIKANSRLPEKEESYFQEQMNYLLPTRLLK